MSDDLMPRPSLRDDYVRQRAAEIIFPKVSGWYGKPQDKCQIMKDLARIASEHRDGYEMSRDLERLGWICDSELVAILDESWVSDAIEELTDQWVRCLNIRPTLAEGDAVLAQVYDRKDQVGVIAKVDTRLARYGVRYPDMKDGSYYVVEFERCRAPLAVSA